MIGNYKTPLVKRNATQAWKDKQYRLQRCRDCGQPTLPTDSLCPVHRRWHQIRVKANRHFMKDFK